MLRLVGHPPIWNQTKVPLVAFTGFADRHISDLAGRTDEIAIMKIFVDTGEIYFYRGTGFSRIDQWASNNRRAGETIASISTGVVCVL